MASRFSYAEIAAAAILVTAGNLADPAAARLLPASLVTDRTEQAAATLRQVAARMGMHLLDETRAGARGPSSDGPTTPPPDFPAAPTPSAASTLS